MIVILSTWDFAHQQHTTLTTQRRDPERQDALELERHFYERDDFDKDLWGTFAASARICNRWDHAGYKFASRPSCGEVRLVKDWP